jgi:hypothetical protein
MVTEREECRMNRDELLKIAKPILFNTEMVKAILSGRKTQTRRPIKPRYRSDEYGFNVCTNERTGKRWVEKCDEDMGDFETTRYVNPPYKPGDILYVRETWAERNGIFAETHGRFEYRADFTEQENEYRISRLGKISAHWRPSIHMPKEAARLFLRVTDVRVERLQEINSDAHDDVLKEGIRVSESELECGYTPTHKFRDLWNAVYGNWDENPWVWVYEFEKVEVERDDD